MNYWNDDVKKMANETVNNVYDFCEETFKDEFMNFPSIKVVDFLSPNNYRIYGVYDLKKNEILISSRASYHLCYKFAGSVLYNKYKRLIVSTDVCMIYKAFILEVILHELFHANQYTFIKYKDIEKIIKYKCVPSIYEKYEEQILSFCKHDVFLFRGYTDVKFTPCLYYDDDKNTFSILGKYKRASSRRIIANIMYTNLYHNIKFRHNKKAFNVFKDKLYEFININTDMDNAFGFYNHIKLYDINSEVTTLSLLINKSNVFDFDNLSILKDFTPFKNSYLYINDKKELCAYEVNNKILSTITRFTESKIANGTKAIKEKFSEYPFDSYFVNILMNKYNRGEKIGYDDNWYWKDTNGLLYNINGIYCHYSELK